MSEQDIVNCLNSGGHYWDDPLEGARYRCTKCGHLGVTNLPSVNECDR